MILLLCRAFDAIALDALKEIDLAITQPIDVLANYVSERFIQDKRFNFHFCPAELNVKPQELAFSYYAGMLALSLNPKRILVLGAHIDAYCVKQLILAGMINSQLQCLATNILATPIEFVQTQTEKCLMANTEHKRANISVIVSHYCRSQLIEETLLGILKQTLPAREIIVVDDHSAEQHFIELQNICANLSQRYKTQIKLKRNNKNIGLGASRNIGAKEATGDWLVFVDDDDVIHPSLLNSLFKVTCKNKVDMVTCAYAYAAQKPRQHQDYYDTAQSRILIYWADEHAMCSIFENNVGGATSLICRNAYLSLGGFHETRDVGADDWHFYTKALNKGLVLFHLPIALMWYRHTSSSMSQTLSYAKRNLFLAESMSMYQRKIDYREILFIQKTHQHLLSLQKYHTVAEYVAQTYASQANLVLFCANEISYVILHYLETKKINKITKVIDSDADKKYKCIGGYLVGDAQYLEITDHVLICSGQYQQQIRAQLQQLGYNNILPPLPDMVVRG